MHIYSRAAAKGKRVQVGVVSLFLSFGKFLVYSNAMISWATTLLFAV